MLKASQEVFLTYSDANALEALITAASNISTNQDSRQDSRRHEQALHSLMDTVLDNRPGSHQPDVNESTHQTLTPVAQTGQEDGGHEGPVVCATQQSSSINLPILAGTETYPDHDSQDSEDEENDEYEDPVSDESEGSKLAGKNEQM